MNVSGFVADAIIVYFFKAFTRLGQFIGSRRWERRGAVITETVAESPGFGCPVAIIRYRVNDEEVTGMAEVQVPFLAAWDAEYFLRRYPVGRQIRVRVHPTQAGTTGFFARDQA